MPQKPLVSIILPSYNRTYYLKEAVDSVYQQTYQNWELIIADDNSEQETQQILKKYIENPKTKLFLNSENLGLFANLNKAIQQSKGEYILILCNDDILSNECLENSIELLQKYPKANLILSCHDTIDEIGSQFNKPHENRSKWLYEVWLDGNSDKLFQSEEILPLLLSNGSINGNISGMFFPRETFENVGTFNENYRQVSDWEWIYRVAKQGNIVLSKTPRTMIRKHSGQLSGVNFHAFINSMEVVEMVNLLLKDSYIGSLRDAKQWANQTMQLHLWYALKGILAGKYLKAFRLIKKIHKTVGLHNAFLAMVKWLPKRWKIYWHKAFPLEKSKKSWNNLKSNS